MLSLDGPWFKDSDTQQTVHLRGINVGGGAKLPVGVPSHEPHGYWVDYDRKVTFVGRPFALAEADTHFERLTAYGFNLLRFVITWEAIEHEGPGIYDDDYLDYVIALLKKAGQHGFKVFMDPHQDTWSRQCGGSGHPGWTLPLVGLDVHQFAPTIAALVHNTYPDPASFPRMIWNTNYDRLAAATMFTLFFAGKTFAPKCIVNDVNIQDYLQQHFFGSLGQLIKRIVAADLADSVVVGYDTMNEPGRGFLAYPDLQKLDDSDISFKMGLMPTPFQAMLLGKGHACKVANYDFVWSGPKKTGDVLVEPPCGAWLGRDEWNKVNALFGWRRGQDWASPGCIWQLHGIWKDEILLRPDYFARHPESGQPTRFAEDYWMPFLIRYIRHVRAIHPNAIIFVQPPILNKPPSLEQDMIDDDDDDDDDNKATRLFTRLVYTPHWYDGLTLVKKKWCSYNIDFINLNRGKYGTGPLRFLRALCVGEKAIRNCFTRQLETIRNEGFEQIGDFPVMLGEIGIPYDMKDTPEDNKKGSTSTSTSASLLGALWSWLSSIFLFFSTTSNHSIGDPESAQNKAMDASIQATESALIHYCLWQYVPDNDAQWGDQWNGEDLSIWQPVTSLPSAQTSLTAQPCALDLESTCTDTTTIDGETAFFNKNNLVPNFSASNARHLPCLLRPYPRLTAGTPLAMQFVSPTRKAKAMYHYEFRPGAAASAPAPASARVTQFFIPSQPFPLAATQVAVSHGKWAIAKEADDYWLLDLTWTDKDDVDDDDTISLDLQGVSFDA
ncbi:glycoside hydrolase superfamily [Gongronella butleri]|nr:glycoside hydrolase superfamily [Gongronella butleri]